MNISNEIRLSYLQLKRDVFYDYSNLFLREAIARFENDNFNEEISICSQKIESYPTNPVKEADWFANQLETIDTFFLPKKIYTPSDNSKKLLSNVRERKDYKIEDLFYYFTGSIPLYIISTLWCRLVGRYLDEELSEDCYGNRLEPINKAKNKSTNYSKLFKLYFTQYGK